MRRNLAPSAAGLLAGALLALGLPLGAPATAADTGGDPETEPEATTPAFSGYTASAWAAPVKIEIYEPTIPIPAKPQLEFELAYTTVEADSGGSAGRASWLWPGDPIGEGFKTIVEQFGLPAQLGEAGYPVQVNAAQPTGAEAEAQEPFPGVVMRTRAGAETTRAQVGFSPDGEVQDGDEESGAESGLPGLPGLPGLSGLTSLGGAPDLLQEFGAAITGGGLGVAADSADPTTDAGADADSAPDSGSGGEADGGGTQAAPALPPEIAALVDLEGFASSSRSTIEDGQVVSVARAALGEVRLLGGLVTLEGVTVTSKSTSDGKRATPDSRVRLGGLSIAGQSFGFGPEGFEAAGQQLPIPGLPDQADQALAALGLSIELPEPTHTRKAGAATSRASGLRVELDSDQLLSKLDALPLATLIDALPSQAGQLKSLLQTGLGLSPRVVLTLGNAVTHIETVEGLDIPTDVPDNDPGSDPPDTADSDEGSAPADPGSSSPGDAPADTGPNSEDPAAAEDLPAAQLTGSGLPPLYSIPGAILVGGLALGALGGAWLRRLGLLALGGGGTCSHGLDSGLPDLRKA